MGCRNDQFCSINFSENVLTNLNEANFFSFTINGSADFTGEDYESLHIRTCKCGIVSDEFFNIGCPDSASSKVIHEHTKNVFASYDMEQVLVGFCADGASNVQGLKSGLAAHLKQSHPHIVTIHCLALRLELAFKDTIKKNPTYEKLTTMLLGLYYLYKRSPKLKQGLKQAFKALDKRVVLPTRVGGTRWLPHINLAIDNFINGYIPIRQHLETVSHENAKAEGLVKIASDGNLLIFVLSLREVITPLVRLS